MKKREINRSTKFRIPDMWLYQMNSFHMHMCAIRIKASFDYCNRYSVIRATWRARNCLSSLCHWVYFKSKWRAFTERTELQECKCCFIYPLGYTWIGCYHILGIIRMRYIWILLFIRGTILSFRLWSHL